jgi:hypothetical protein
MKKKSGNLISVILPLVIAIAAGFFLFSHNQPARKQVVKPSLPIPVTEHLYATAKKHGWLNGVALHRNSDLAQWVRVTGEHPDVVSIYTRLRQPFPYWEVRSIGRTGALPFLQLNPRFSSMQAIANGNLDAHIREWAASLHKLHIPVAVSFAHEMNGTWDTWGCASTSGKLFVRVWRHIHDIIGTHDVIWIWNVNNVWLNSCPMRPRYPGKAYVDWIGIDGYLLGKESSFKSVFALTLLKLRRFTLGKPILLTETGVPVGVRQAAKIRSLYEGAHHEGLLGIIYFDSETSKGDYRPQDSLTGLREFRKMISQR